MLNEALRAALIDPAHHYTVVCTPVFNGLFPTQPCTLTQRRTPSFNPTRNNTFVNIQCINSVRLCNNIHSMYTFSDDVPG